MHVAGVAKNAVTAVHPATIALQDLLCGDITILSFLVRRVIENVDEVVRDLESR